VTLLWLPAITTPPLTLPPIDMEFCSGPAK
jgi:hypothetical protein